MADGDPVIHCPLCGNKVPPGADKCPVCATQLQGSRRGTHELGPPRIDDYLHKEIPKVELPVQMMSCPLCGVALEGGEVKCPRCGTPLVSDNEMLECPECGALTPPGSKKCPKCGVGFEEAQVVSMPALETPRGPPLQKPIEQEPASMPVVVETEQILSIPDRMPETSASTPRVASAREGLVNGRGAVNGTGLVNGTGMTNGTMQEVGRSASRSARRSGTFISRWQFLAVLVAIVVIIPAFFYLSYVRQPGTISIDGKFGDWSGVDRFGIDTPTSAASIDIDQWAVVTEGSSIYLYLRVQSGLMVTSGVDSFYLFIDSDDSFDTGYAVSGIGADYLLELDGWNGAVQSTSVASYRSTTDHLDWSSWEGLGSMSASLGSDQLECMAELPVTVPTTAKLVLMSQNPQEQKAVSSAVPVKGGLLVVEQELNPVNAPNGLVPSSASVQLLRLHLRADGADGTVSAILPSVVGAKTGPAVAPLELTSGEERVVDVAVDTSSCPSGTLVVVSVPPAGITSSFASVSVIGAPAKAYAIASPSDIVIDGAFGDWLGKIASDPDSASNPDVDVTATGAVNTSISSSFFVSVRGNICNGTFVPALRVRPTGTPGGGGGVLPRVTGEDILRVYIDTDVSTASGQVLSGAGKTIGADHLIDVRGFYGSITSTTFKSHLAGAWTTVPGVTILAANDESRLELSVPAARLGGNSSIDFIIESTDWRGRGDLATAVPIGASALSGSLTVGIQSWAISSTTSATATAMSYQRKLFYDGVNIWSFYSDGANTVCRYTTDGVTWSASSRVFVTAGVLDASIWYDPANLAVYVVGDTAGASVNVRLQKGSVAPATHAITWAAVDSNLATSTVALGSKNTFISRDAAGYVWLLSSNCTQTTPTRYDLSAFRSTAVDSISAWTMSQNMLSAEPPVNQPNLVGSVLPAGSGSNVWAVYSYLGNVAARKYTGTWAAQQTIFAAGGMAAQTDMAPPCAVVGSNGVVHVIYGDNHQQPVGTLKPHIYYVYNSSATTWSAPAAISGTPNNDGFVYPTLSLDSSTGDLYAIAVRISDQNIIGWKKAGGVWTAQSYGTQTSLTKQYLTSIYSAPGQLLICWQWTQNATAPIDVVYDQLPEFGDVSVPIIIALSILLVAVGRRARRKE